MRSACLDDCARNDNARTNSVKARWSERFAEQDELGEALEQPTRLQIWKGESPFSVNYL
jgi:hypothetical protein